MRKSLDEARQIERDLQDMVENGAKAAFASCRKRVEQFEMALKSDLFENFEEEDVNRLHALAASVRIKYSLASKELEHALRLADQIDETVATFEVAQELRDKGGKQDAAHRLKELIEELRSVHDRTQVVCGQIRIQAQDQARIFDSMRMMTLADAAERLRAAQPEGSDPEASILSAERARA